MSTTYGIFSGYLTVTLVSLLISGCSEGSFSGDSERAGVVKKPPVVPSNDSTPNNPGDPDKNPAPTPSPSPTDNPTVNTDDGGLNQFQPCTRELRVPGRSNPFLAGMPAGTSISYSWAPTPDQAATESPVQLIPDRPDCLKEGSRIAFNISGRISHGGSKATDADGKQDDIKWHQKGALNGKSNIRAPLNSMVAVFLGDGVPAGVPPASDFLSATSRDYSTISPALGQIIFVGDGKRRDGTLQEVVVPVGAKRLFLGIMDGYEWRNNSGELAGGFSVKK